MESERRRDLTRRKPLSDCTNSHPPSSSHSSLAVKPTEPNPSPSSAFEKPTTRSFWNLHNASNPISLPPNILSTPSPPLKTSSLPGTFNALTSGAIDRDFSEPISVVCGPSHTSDKRNCDNASNSSSLRPSNVSTPIGSQKTFSLAGSNDVEVSEPISIVYSRRRASNKRKNKEKAVATVSSTPILKISSSREKNDGLEGANLPKAKALTVPCRKKPRAVSSEQDVFKDALLQDFIEKQKAYFKVIDEFKLPEEEVESIDELE